MKKKVYLEYFVAGVLILLAEMFFFRTVLNPYDLLGDNGDGRLCTLITEHWYQFFLGKESFSNLRMFYPAQSVIGYSDMLLGYGIVHSLFRVLGCNIYLSYKCTLIAFHFVGTVFMYLVLRRSLKLDLGWTTIGVISFSYSMQYSIRMAHTQLMAISMLPVILFFILIYWQNRENKKRYKYAIIAITTFVVLMYTAWYIAFFSIVFCLIWAVILLVFVICRKCVNRKDTLTVIRFYWKEACIYMVYAVVLLIPFLRIYLPQMKDSGARSWGDVLIFLPELRDYLNVTTNNLLFGKWMEKIPFQATYETTVGYVLPFILLLILISAWILLRKNKSLLLCSLMIATVLGFFIIVKWGDTGFALWYAIYRIVPGAGSIRAAGRYAFFLSVPASIVVTVGGNSLFQCKKRGILYGILMSICCIFLWISNINTIGMYSHWRADTQLAFVENLQAPPEECKVFYIKDTGENASPQYVYQLDAFEIATTYGLVTVNGYSGQSPKGWGGLWEVRGEGYESSAIAWADSNNLECLYSYDVATKTWERVYTKQ